MKKNFNMTVELTPEDVKEAITLYLRNEFPEGFVCETEFDVGTEYEDRPCGGSYPVFRGAKVSIKKTWIISGSIRRSS